MSDRKIIACTVKPGFNTDTDEVSFISERGYVTCVCLDKVISANVTGDRIVIMCEGANTHSRYINVYDANTCALIEVLPA